MAIFHFNMKNISANKGRCSVAAASYRSGEKLYCERLNMTFDYEKNKGTTAFILKPDHAPNWCLDRSQLWNEVEKIEKANNSRYAKEINIALPIELSYNEQENLIKDYCQKYFVDKGMVADICIHRHDIHNPHFHVMLTNRPFNLDGTWGKKSNIEYILDKDGNKTFTKKGNVRKNKTPTTNWDSTQTLIEWRREWANAVNRKLELNGFTERISAESFETDGIKKTPTVHEGKGVQSKERKQYNSNIRHEERAVKDLVDIKEKIFTYERFDLLTKNLTEKEKDLIKELSGTLKTFVNFQNVEDKKRMINNWSNSTYVKFNFGMDVAKTLQNIENQEKAVNEADRLLIDVGRRLLTKEYKFLDINRLTDFEIKWVADKTITNGVYTTDQLHNELKELRPYLLEKQVLLITEKPFASWLTLENMHQETMHKLSGIFEIYNRNLDTYQNTNGLPADQFYAKDYKGLQYLIKDKTRLELLKEVVIQHYDEMLSKSLPDLKVDKLSILKKEQLYNLLLYYNPDHAQLSFAELLKLTDSNKFTAQQRKDGLKYICNGDQNLVKDNPELKRILNNNSLRTLFIGECMEDKTVNPQLLEQAISSTQQEEKEVQEYAKELNPNYSIPMHNTVGLSNHIKSILDIGEHFLYISEVERQQRIAIDKKTDMEEKKEELRKKYNNPKL